MVTINTHHASCGADVSEIMFMNVEAVEDFYVGPYNVYCNFYAVKVVEVSNHDTDRNCLECDRVLRETVNGFAYCYSYGEKDRMGTGFSRWTNDPEDLALELQERGWVNEFFVNTVRLDMLPLVLK